MPTLEELGKERVKELADKWLTFSPEQQEIIARKVGYSTHYLKIYLRSVRGYESLPSTLSSPKPPQTAPIIQEPVKQPAFEPTSHVMLKAAVFDLECTDFGTEGYAGLMVCCSILPLDTGQVTTLQLNFDDKTDDRRLVRNTIKTLSQYDILIGHNVAAFDFNWLHSRWFFHTARGSNVGNWRRWLYVDTYQNAKGMALKTRKGLGNLGDYFGLTGEKTNIYKTSWNNIRSPYRDEFDEAMTNIVYHCEQDVILNRHLFDILWFDALSMRTNPLKMTKWGAILGYHQPVIETSTQPFLQ